MKKIFEHDNKLWIVHRTISESQMHPKFYGYNSNDVNAIVRAWVEWLRDNCKDIQKVFNKNGQFLFCEPIQEAEIL